MSWKNIYLGKPPLIKRVLSMKYPAFDAIDLKNNIETLGILELSPHKSFQMKINQEKVR